ncbi:MAG: preprotein translocase subunit SecF [Bacteroidia bacterium]|jgi:preprotein translocase subunit SecF
MSEKIINFMGARKLAAAFSIVLVLISLGSLAFKGLNFGLDFTGGTLVEVVYEEPQSLDIVRSVLADAGYEQAIVVNFGADTDVLVRLNQGLSPELGDQILQVLEQSAGSSVELRRIEFVGPQVGEELREQGGLAILMALAIVLIYISMRFQLKFAFGAVVALGHDVVIVLGAFSLFNFDFDLTVLGALLAVIGYSLNDTIVVSDRIRENFRKLRKQPSIDVVNISLTQTLGRTLVTSLTTLLVLLALLFVGGEMISGFAKALTIGVVVGTYSSVYVAANFMLMLGLAKEDLMVPEKEGEPIDDLP